MKTFVPSPSLLQKYAKLLVNYALNSGQGVNKNEVVRLIAPESAKPLLLALRNQVLLSGAHPLVFMQPDGFSRSFFELASTDQLSFFPKNYLHGLSLDIDHTISIISEVDKHELKGIDPQKTMTKIIAQKPFKDWLDKKENSGKYTWTIALYGTPAMAKEAGLSISKYWEQIITACYLDFPDPIKKWQDISKKQDQLIKRLNSLEIQTLHIKGRHIDLDISLGAKRRWLGGSGRNIPSFEVFTSPDWRGTNGWIKFNQPLYRYGSLVSGIELNFKDGRVVNFKAAKNRLVLEKLIQVKNADKIGEFSLTDKNFSRIQKFMAETLYDENISGPFGNTHIALGSAYADTYSGPLNTLNGRLKNQLGFNDSPVHVDIVSTSDRTVTATTSTGSNILIYKNGEFVV